MALCAILPAVLILLAAGQKRCYHGYLLTVASGLRIADLTESMMRLNEADRQRGHNH